MNTLEFHTWIEQAAQADRIDVIDSMIPMILSTASPEERKNLAWHLDYLTNKKISDDALAAVFTKLPPGATGALRFVASRLKDPGLSRLHMTLFLENLGDAAGACLINCLFMGEYTLARDILNRYPEEFPVELTLSSGLFVKDHEVSLRSEEMEGFHGPKDIKRCFEMLADKSIILPTEDGSNMALYWALDASKKSDALDCLAKPFNGNIPVVAQNTLCNPELALALIEARDQQAQFPEIYSHFPAWVSDDEISGYPGAIAFRSEIRSAWGEKLTRTLTNFDTYSELRGEDFPSHKDTTKIRGIRALQSLTIGLFTDLEPWEHNLYHRYLEHFTDDFALLGLENKPGMTLTLLPLDVMREMEVAPVDSARLSEAMAYANDFFPLDVLINRQAGEKKSSARSEHKNLFSTLGAIGMLNEVAKSPHRERLYALFPFQMIEDAIAYAKFHLSADALIDLQKRFGLKPPHDEHVVANLEYSKLDALHRAGYDLWVDDAKTVRRSILLNGRFDTPEPFLQILQMGGYPHGHPEPTIEVALKNVNKRASAAFEKAYLLHKGPIEVARVARTPGDWATFMAIFTQDEKAQALDLIPAKRREEFFAGDLGL